MYALSKYSSSINILCCGIPVTKQRNPSQRKKLIHSLYVLIIVYFLTAGRPPGPELDNCTDRESYSLAAGLALGLVMFGVRYATQ